MSRTISLSKETSLWILRLLERGSEQDRNLAAAIIQEHLDWRDPHGPKIYRSDARAEQREHWKALSRKVEAGRKSTLGP